MSKTGENGQDRADSAVILFPDREKLLEEVGRLKTEISMLVLERDGLLLQVCPNIEAAYMLALGGLEYKVYAAECEYLRQKRRFEMIAARFNRQEKIILGEIESALDREFEEYRINLEKKLNDMNAALDRSMRSVAMTEAESNELKALYRGIVKRLHPDLHPELSEGALKLFYAAAEAYKNGDLNVLRAIAEAAEGVGEHDGKEDSALELRSAKTRLEAILRELRESIERIKTSYPYTLKPFVDDGEKTAARRAELEEALRSFEEAAAVYAARAEELVKGAEA